MEKLTPKQKIRSIIKKPKEKFLTQSQEEYWKVLDDNVITFCSGYAGTGKSYISLKKAMDLLWTEDNKFEKLIIIRPAVEADEKLGSLPGNLEEKLLPYLFPTYYLLEKIIGKESVEKLKFEGIIEVAALAYIRGRNIDNSILIFEEAQNSTVKQIKTLITRIGFNSKFFISGDVDQSDKFNDVKLSGLYDARNRFINVKKIGMFDFNNKKDIVRHPIISEILECYE